MPAPLKHTARHRCRNETGTQPTRRRVNVRCPLLFPGLNFLINKLIVT